VTIKEAVNLLDYLKGEPLVLEGIEEASIVYSVKDPFNIKL
jgi:hypothetical protein